MSLPSDSPNCPEVQQWVRAAISADGPSIDAWLNARAPLPVPEARARRLSLDALLEQGGHGICLAGSTNAGQDRLVCLMPVTLVQSLALGGRVAMVAEWWPPSDASSESWRDACCAVLADWCRAHGIRHVLLAPGLVADAARPPEGFQRDADGLWRRSLVPSPKRLG